MAFATQRVQKEYLGHLKVTYGEWSGADADGSGTIGVEGGMVYDAKFTSQDASAKWDVRHKVSNSVSGAVSTVTVYYNAAVTNGRFLIIHS